MIEKTLCIAGKNAIACEFLQWVVSQQISRDSIVVVCNQDETGKHTWQPSLRFTARKLGVEEINLEEAYSIPEMSFLSLEFDKILDPKKFATKNLFNLHFSFLPKYRGVATAVWPLYYGDKTSGVTLHEIDAGIDTGGIIFQESFEIDIADTSREVYHSCMDLGFSLLTNQYDKILSGEYNVSPQPCENATYFGKGSIDYRDPPIEFHATAWQAHNAIRAFTFHEYQYPNVKNIGRVLRSEITSEKSKAKPGTSKRQSEWTVTVATTDFDLLLELSPYEQIYKWAEGIEKCPDGFGEAIELIELDSMNSKGWSPLMVCSYHGNTHVVEQLLELGADPNCVGLRGTTPLMYAKENFRCTGNSDCFEALLEAGADVALADCHGKTISDYIRVEDLPRLAGLM